MNSEKKVIPRIMLAAARSGSGKTLLTCGILQVLKERGLKPASFKCGPDYIDPMFHSRVIGAKSRNLDTFFADEETVRYLLAKNAADCDISVLEGVMGYYDGLGGISDKASAYDVASVTDTPVVMIADCRGLSLSLIPYLKGFVEYRRDSRIRGVIFNRISPMMYPRMKELVEKELPGLRVLGYVPMLTDCVLESRHLGLVMPEEIRDLREKLQRLAGELTKTLDVEGLLALAHEAPPLLADVQGCRESWHTKKPVQIGVARDEAFCFFYQDNLDLLEEMGARLVYFSPIHDRKLPDHLQGLMLNGGYPELYARQLSANTSMRTSIREALEGGMPYTAECGGFLYLHRELEDMDGNSWPMAGVIDGKGYRTPRLSRFGYVTLEEGCCFGRQTGPIPAHEFHYFDSDNCGEAFTARKPAGSRSWKCIHSSGQGLAGFPHLYYYGNRKVARAFLSACEEWEERL